jgi:type I restriction enzyme, S subunit
LSSDRQTYLVAKLIQDNILTIGDGYRAKNVELAATGIPFARVANIDGGFNFAEADLFPLDGLSKVGEKIGRPGDVVLTSKGTVGRFAFVHEETPRFVYSPQLSYWRSLDFKTIYPRYLFYWIQGEEFQEQADGVKSQTDMADYVSLTDQRRMKITLPPIDEQYAVARILGALDDKIELNRRMNHTLEEMAQLLFEQWFVNHEDVESWKVVPLPEIIEVNPFRSLKKGAIAPYLDMANMPTHGHRGIEWVDRPYGSGTKFINGDTLLARITPCLENGKTAFVDFLQDGQVGWGSTEYIIFRPKPPLPPEYGYYLARGEELRNHAIRNMIGTSGRQRTPASCFNTYRIVNPPVELASKFGDVAKSVVNKVRANDNESRTLVAIRDALLPQLLSGELRVKQAEKVIEDM